MNQLSELPEMRGPIISINVTVEAEFSNFEFYSPNVPDPLFFPSPMRRGALEKQRKKFYVELDKFKKTIGSKMDLGKLSVVQPKGRLSRFFDWFLTGTTVGDEANAEKTEWAKITESFKILRSLGNALANQLFGNELPNVQDFFLKAIPLRDNSNIDNPPLIEVTAPLTDLIPIEFLPLFDFSELKDGFEIKDVGQLASEMRRFVGMSTVVKRVIVTEPLPKSRDILENDPSLPISFFQHVGLPATQREYEFLKRQMSTGLVSLSNPWPDHAFDDKEKLVKALGDALWLNEYEIEGERRPYQIHHFACHCNTGEKDEEEYFLELASDENNPAKVSIHELEARRAEIVTKRRDKALAIQPLVFFNACGSAKMSPAGISSFPDLFLRTNSCGFIGTETLIPDTLASDFSVRFYRWFLTGKPLGLAVHKAKWELLTDFNNPLGILYVLYANPEMHVRDQTRRVAGLQETQSSDHHSGFPQ